ncbi:hypothetical protein NIES21_30670 [Anabaenopsis circularis NIES-21]|uniref:Uncharacterized protein n=1 Tax=Anabaenopsis circularis NIES-21 TaxID=1085406 RepID=A0A1Z4GID5_9CYAN|nr:hypothetical protein NIES21_30670 [Anabaenopsis circularis NIES-21]
MPNYLAYLSLILLGILLILIVYIAYLYFTTVNKLNKALHQSQLPEELVNFPVYSSTPEEYSSVKIRIAAFIEACNNNRTFELHLTANDLNCLRNKGHEPNIESLKRPEYYEITENKIIERRAVFPWPFNRYGCINDVKYIDFIFKNGGLIEQSSIMARHNKEIPKARQNFIEYPIIQSKLLLQVFSHGFNGTENSNLMNIIEKIKNIKINNSEFIFYI